MPWEKTPAEVIAAFEAAAPQDPRVEARPMFGYRALFIGGNMFAGTFRDQVIVRLADGEKPKGAQPFAPMPGRPMREYVVVPAETVRRPAELKKWIAMAHERAMTLPPKKSAVKRGAAKSRKPATSRAKTNAPKKAATKRR